MREVSCPCRVIRSVIALELSFITASPPSQRYRSRRWEEIPHRFVGEGSWDKLQTCLGVGGWVGGGVQFATLDRSVIIKRSTKLQQLHF